MRSAGATSFRGARRPARAAALAGLAAALAAAPCAAAVEAPPAFKIFLERAGVHRVAFDDLRAAGLEAGAMPTSGLGVTQRGEPVPIWVEDGGDGRFGPGDWLELVGEPLAGEVSTYDPYSRYNVYRLRFDHPAPARMRALAAEAAPSGEAAGAPLRARRHLEEDLILLRLAPAPGGGPEELWFWEKLVSHREEPFRQRLELEGLDRGAADPVRLRLHFRGWSSPRRKAGPEVRDHVVEVSLDGEPLAEAAWDGTEPFLLEAPPVDPRRFAEAGSWLEIRLPRRPGGEGGRTLVDAVMLNWIEVVYPRAPRFAGGQARFEAAGAGTVALAAQTPALTVYGERGWRVAWPGAAPAAGRAVAAFRPPPGESAFFAAEPSALLAPAGIDVDLPSALAAPENRADYLIVGHGKLLPAVEPLAAFHRSAGLAVEVVDVEDVYDEFNHGLPHPRALRDFVARARSAWRPPAPRYLLLVGDASWDARNERAVDANYADWTYRPNEGAAFPKNQSTAYPEEEGRNRRGLVPTWNFTSYEGHSASDNFFVEVEGDDGLPDLAVGRLPVVEPSEVAAIVDKTIRYASRPEVGPWRRSVLFITNESVGLQRQSDRLALEVAARGLAPRRVYPASSEKSNEHHTRELIGLFSRGQLLVHFIGHGGRYIWRTGPPDLEKNHDLLTLDHLEEIEPSGRLPVVLSMTCYSAPFDHPSADSIGEKLLRLPDRGAVAVVAASWRNTPQGRWGRTLLEELVAPGATVGEAVMRAKRRVQAPIFVETYNLLGDPAAPVALPAGAIALDASFDGGGRVTLGGSLEPSDFAGRLLVELVDRRGEPLHETRAAVDGGRFEIEISAPAEVWGEAAAIRAYAWSDERQLDAVGGVELPARPGVAARRPAEGGGG